MAALDGVKNRVRSILHAQCCLVSSHPCPAPYFAAQDVALLVSGVAWTVLGMFKKLWKRRDETLRAWVSLLGGAHI